MTVKTKRNPKPVMDPAKTYGLCAGRHDMPVCEYIFEQVENVFDFASLEEICEKFVEEHCNVHWAVDTPINGMTDGTLLRGDELHVAVTGLTPCTAALMYVCATNGVPLVLWHYNRETEEYVPQCFDF